MEPQVSIIITCYELGQYLDECVVSVLDDPDPTPRELIIVDDGSTGAETIDALQRAEVKGVRVHRQPNRGLGAARNAGIVLARGAYIIPLDADNRLRPAFIPAAVAVLAAHPKVDIVHGDAEFFGERTGRWTMRPMDLRRLLRSNGIDACACYRRSLWERLGGYDEHMPAMGWEDWDFWLRAAVTGAQFHYVPEIFFDYRVRSGSMIAGTQDHREELTEHIFNKPQLRFLKDLREDYMALLQWNVQHASDAQLMRWTLGRIKQRLFPWTRKRDPDV